MDVSDEVYAALEPMDGFPKGTRAGARPYRYRDWWVVISLSDFGDLLVGAWGPLHSAAGDAHNERVEDNV